MSADLPADYRRRGWALVPIARGEKCPRRNNWETREFAPRDFPPGGNVGLILGPRSDEICDVDLDCSEALELADFYLLPTRAIFGRASKRRSHRLYVALGTAFASFADPQSQKTLLELRARGATGGEHQTIIPPSIHPTGEPVEWDGPVIAPGVVDAARLHRRCAFMAMACLLLRYDISQHAVWNPAPDMPRILWDADPTLGRAAYRWIGEADPDAPRRQPRDRTRAEMNLAEIVAAIPNDCDWAGWNRIGLAIYAASGGSDQGGIIFDEYSARSNKYHPSDTVARWRHYHRSPPSRIGLGTLIHLARLAGSKGAES
jgi:Primase C terminal 2 (PriCT-2)/Bifunctional DNA primase/polymerase, N-terminal